MQRGPRNPVTPSETGFLLEAIDQLMHDHTRLVLVALGAILCWGDGSPESGSLVLVQADASRSHEDG